MGQFYASAPWIAGEIERSKLICMKGAYQNTNFRLNCNSRMSIPERVLVIVPKLPVPTTGTPFASVRLFPNVRFGSPKFGWFRKLKTSNRNWR